MKVSLPKIEIEIVLISLIVTGLVLFLQVRASSPAKKDYNCSDFTTRAEAQKFLLPGDPYHLDGNHNKVACDNLK